MNANELKALKESEVIAKVGPLFTEDQKKTGILASISLAQFILESGYGQSELAQKANNCFGMKKSLSGNTWKGTSWDGKSVYSKKTQEQDSNGRSYTVTAEFRKYSTIEQSISDHSAYLSGAMNGKKLRYYGLVGETDAKKAATIIKSGGYATDTKYVEKLLDIIKRWNLGKYDYGSDKYYRVRKEWTDAQSQKGAFLNLEYAKDCADSYKGFCVFDPDGKCIYPSHLKRAAYWMPVVYDKIVTIGASHKSGAKDYEDIIAKKITTCNDSVRAVLIKAGVLKPGASFGHTTKDGKSGATKKTPESAIKGLNNLIPGTYDLVRVNCVYNDLGSAYKKAGIVYIQDSNACMCAGDGWIFSTNEGSIQVKNGCYVQTKVKSGYPFNHKILYVLIPAN